MTCKICGQEYNYKCKKCKSEYSKNWARNNKERKKEIARKSREKNKERNREKYRDAKREWKKNNKDKVNAGSRRRWKEKKDAGFKFKVYPWNPRNPNKHRFNRRMYSDKLKGLGKFSFEQWNTLCTYYGNICLCCKSKTKITIDHIMPVSEGGQNIITNVQPLCSKCNSSKHTKTIDYRPDKGEFAEILFQFSK